MRFILFIILFLIYMVCAIPLLLFGMLYSLYMADGKGIKLLWNDITAGKFQSNWEDDFFGD